MLYEFENQIVNAALQWAAMSKEAVKAANWAAKTVKGAEEKADFVRVWADSADKAAWRAVAARGREAAEEAIRAAEAMVYATAYEAESMVADQGRQMQAVTYFNTASSKLAAAALDMLNWVVDAAVPTEKDGWCEVMSYLADVEDEVRREMVEHSNYAAKLLKYLEARASRADEIWDFAVEVLMEAAEVEDEWKTAMKEWEEAAKEIEEEDVIAAAEEMISQAANMTAGWAAQWAEKRFNGATIDIAVAAAGCLGATVAACEGKDPSQVRIAGHAARRRLLRWLAAEAKARRQ